MHGTKAELKEAMKICSESDADCRTCPYDEYCRNSPAFAADALELVTELEKERDFQIEDKEYHIRDYIEYWDVVIKEIESHKSGSVSAIEARALGDVLNFLKKGEWPEHEEPEVVYTTRLDSCVKPISLSFDESYSEAISKAAASLGEWAVSAKEAIASSSALAF